jgi:CarD family transcriptional regulator
VQFTKGQTVVHPHHGPALITEERRRKVKGENVTYLTLSVIDSDLTVSVPLDHADDIGLRDVFSSEKVQKVFETLADEPDTSETNWSRRFKANRDMVATGDPIKAAEVIRNVMSRAQEKSLSFGERSQLDGAILPIAAELAIALKVSTSDAQALIEHAVLQRDAGVWKHGLPTEKAIA